MVNSKEKSHSNDANPLESYAFYVFTIKLWILDSTLAVIFLTGTFLGEMEKFPSLVKTEISNRFRITSKMSTYSVAFWVRV